MATPSKVHTGYGSGIAWTKNMSITESRFLTRLTEGASGTIYSNRNRGEVFQSKLRFLWQLPTRRLNVTKTPLVWQGINTMAEGQCCSCLRHIAGGCTILGQRDTNFRLLGDAFGADNEGSAEYSCKILVRSRYLERLSMARIGGEVEKQVDQFYVTYISDGCYLSLPIAQEECL